MWQVKSLVLPADNRESIVLLNSVFTIIKINYKKKTIFVNGNLLKKY